VLIVVIDGPTVLEVAEDMALKGVVVIVATYLDLGFVAKSFSSYNFARLMASASKFDQNGITSRRIFDLSPKIKQLK